MADQPATPKKTYDSPFDVRPSLERHCPACGGLGKKRGVRCAMCGGNGKSREMSSPKPSPK